MLKLMLYLLEAFNSLLCSLTASGYLYLQVPIAAHICGVGGKMSDTSKISNSNTDSDSKLRLLNITLMKFSCKQFCSNYQAMKILIHSKNSLF